MQTKKPKLFKVDVELLINEINKSNYQSYSHLQVKTQRKSKATGR